MVGNRSKQTSILLERRIVDFFFCIPQNEFSLFSQGILSTEYKRSPSAEINDKVFRLIATGHMLPAL